MSNVRPKICGSVIRGELVVGGTYHESLYLKSVSSQLLVQVAHEYSYMSSPVNGSYGMCCRQIVHSIQTHR